MIPPIGAMFIVNGPTALVMPAEFVVDVACPPVPMRYDRKPAWTPDSVVEPSENERSFTSILATDCALAPLAPNATRPAAVKTKVDTLCKDIGRIFLTPGNRDGTTRRGAA